MSPTASASMRERVRQRVKARTNGNTPGPEGSPLLDAALSYVRRGWLVLPVHTPTRGGCSCGKRDCVSVGKHPRTEHGVKDATTDEAQIRKWWEQWPDANIGIATGVVSGLVVLDVDPRHGGDDTLRELEAQHGALPPTVEALTGGSGFHRLFKYPGPVKSGAGALGPGLDIKGDGGYIVAAPSLHTSGRRYVWEASSHPDEVPIAEAPAWLLALLRAAQNGNGHGCGFTVGEKIKEGERNATLYRIARSLKAKGLSYVVILATLRAANAEQCEPLLPDAEVERIAANAVGQPDRKEFQQNCNGSSSEEQRQKAASISAHLTDTGNAKRFAEQHGRHARYCHPWRKWLLYEEGCWRSDDHGGAVALAKQTVTRIYEEAALAGDEDTRKAIAKHAARSENEARTRAMLSLAQSEPGIPVTPDELDADGWLLNVANGTIDLRTGRLREHRPTDLLTKLAPVAFDPQATCPTFEAFLRRTFADDPDLIHFVQKLAGYSLTAETREQCFAFCHGAGANGKSTLLRVLTEVLGSYATWTPAETFLLKRGGGVPNDVAALRNTRLVAAAEPEAGKRLAAALMKAVTGQDRIAARFLYGEFFTFLPQFKIWLATNHKPEVKETTHALWRRVMLIPFEVVIPSHQQDRSLPDKLRAEYPGILRWAIEGCLAWQREGLGQPRAVRQATSAYRKEQDSFAQFVEGCCVTDDRAEELAGKLYREYRQWAERVGERPETQTAFGTRLSERGFPAVGRGGRRYRQGLRLKRLADGENE